MSSSIQAVRGMRDVMPEEARRWRSVENALERVLLSFAYEEVQLPLLEFTELFSRGVGEATDIVEKEMYSLADRDGTSITLRPEGTAGCVRALQQHGLLFNQTQRVFYRGPMFRYERPQKGRYRQFYQIGAEVFGLPGPESDAELLALCHQFWTELGLSSMVELELNTMGSSDCRSAYRAALVDYLTPLREKLDADSQRRLDTNPLRILDSKAESTRDLLTQAPRMSDYLNDESRRHFDELCELLTKLGIGFRLNDRLVRGLDYYTDTVFEWTTTALGAQGTICGGGRYDGLVELLGGKPTAGAGFAVGVERVALLYEQVARSDAEARAADVYCCVMDPEHQAWSMRLAQQLRDRMPASRIRVHAGGGKLKNQLRRADASGAVWALIIGAEEVATGQVTVKPLRADLAQQKVAIDALVDMLAHDPQARGD